MKLVFPTLRDTAPNIKNFSAWVAGTFGDGQETEFLIQHDAGTCQIIPQFFLANGVPCEGLARKWDNKFLVYTFSFPPPTDGIHFRIYW